MEGAGKFIAIVVVILLIVGGVLFGVNRCQAGEIKTLEEHVEYLEKEYVPMEFEITKKSDSEIKLKAIFYDLDGDKVGSKSIKIEGNELNIDFRTRKISENGYLFFPYGIYSDKVPMSESIKLYDEYDDNGFPAIYNGITDIKDDEGEKLNKKSQKFIEEQLEVEFLNIKDAESGGIALHDLENISDFKKNTIYKVVCHPSSGTLDYRIRQ